MAIEIVDFPIKNGGSFHSYVSLPEGKLYTSNNQFEVFQAETKCKIHWVPNSLASYQPKPSKTVIQNIPKSGDMCIYIYIEYV